MADRHHRPARRAAAVHQPARHRAVPADHPAAVVTAPQVVSVIHTGSAGEADVFAATVSVTERPYASANPPARSTGCRCRCGTTSPARSPCPRGSTAPAPVRTSGSVTGRCCQRRQPGLRGGRGFIRTYLTATTGLDRYVLAGTALAPVGGYQSAIVSTAATERPVPDDAPAGAQVHVLATVVAQTAQFATVQPGLSADRRK